MKEETFMKNVSEKEALIIKKLADKNMLVSEICKITGHSESTVNFVLRIGGKDDRP